jgi:hypothetical protein
MSRTSVGSDDIVNCREGDEDPRSLREGDLTDVKCLVIYAPHHAPAEPVGTFSKKRLVWLSAAVKKVSRGC